MPKTPNQRLLELKDRYKLTQSDIATLTRRTKNAVSRWFIDPRLSSYRPMQQETLELFEIRAPAYAAAKSKGKI